MVQLSYPYTTTGKTVALTIRTFVGKVMSLLFNMLPSFSIAFVQRHKCILISWLSPSIVIFRAQEEVKSFINAINRSHGSENVPTCWNRV